MCEQAARYCRDGVHKLLHKEQPKLGAQNSETATAAQSGSSGAQLGGIDGLVRWIVTKMSDNKNISPREFLKEEPGAAREQFFNPEPRKGISVILDIFRRADKNDDGKLSLDEFQAFFSDGTLNEEELEKLFHTIDSDNTRITASRVSLRLDYFASHMGDYEDVLASLETLNLSILKAMDYTKRECPGQGPLGRCDQDSPSWGSWDECCRGQGQALKTVQKYFSQYRFRFLLALFSSNELHASKGSSSSALTAINSLARGTRAGPSQECFTAKDPPSRQYCLRYKTSKQLRQQKKLNTFLLNNAIEEQSSQSGHYPSRGGHRIADTRYESPVPEYPPNNRVTTKEAKKNIQTGKGTVEMREEGLEAQINRLAELIGRLENKTVWFDLHQRLTDTDGTASAWKACPPPTCPLPPPTAPGGAHLFPLSPCGGCVGPHWIPPSSSLWGPQPVLACPRAVLLRHSSKTQSPSLYLVRQEMAVSQKHLGEFCEALKQYLKNVSAQRDCFHVTAVRLPDGMTFVVYEFWEGEEEWKRHLQSVPCKVFQHVKVDTLCQPEAVSTVAVPGQHQ
ncbi:NECA2 protein, partial [Atractosteus spatula]|nr:NECA2 protein [Atractosteus spatula]